LWIHLFWIRRWLLLFVHVEVVVLGNELSFVFMDIASPYTVGYDGGQKGPWSETVSATITA